MQINVTTQNKNFVIMNWKQNNAIRSNYVSFVKSSCLVLKMLYENGTLGRCYGLSVSTRWIKLPQRMKNVSAKKRPFANIVRRWPVSNGRSRRGLHNLPMSLSYADRGRRKIINLNEQGNKRIMRRINNVLRSRLMSA